MNKKTTLIAGSLLMAAGVALGAFGAHAWKEMLTLSGRSDTYETGIGYLMVHALALLIVGSVMEKYPRLNLSAWFFLAGIFFFSGSLITLALSNNAMWGAVAPVGGTAMILGWLSAAYAVFRD